MSDPHQSSEARQARLAVLVFPIVIIAFGIAGTLLPDVASPLTPYVPILLGVVMFTMGLTLQVPDLKILVKAPQAVLIGVVAQYLIMPLAGLGVGIAFNMDPLLIVGMVLLGSVPGGASSNIVAYLANGNVALSVALTSISTALSPLISPLLILWLAGSYLPMDPASMMRQILQMVIVPIVLGIIVQMFLKKFISRISGIVPWVSVGALALVIAGIMAGSAEVVIQSGIVVILAVVAHNAIGFALGYLAARAARLGTRERRAIAVEVGMQNAGLAAALANAHFGPLASLPAAVATIWHNVAGSILATIFTRSDAKAQSTSQARID